MNSGRACLNEFLTSFSADRSVLWSIFILGVVIAAALGLTLFWGAVFRLGSMISSLTKKTSSDGKNVLP